MDIMVQQLYSIISSKLADVADSRLYGSEFRMSIGGALIQPETHLIYQL